MKSRRGSLGPFGPSSKGKFLKPQDSNTLLIKRGSITVLFILVLEPLKMKTYFTMIRHGYGQKRRLKDLEAQEEALDGQADLILKDSTLYDQ